MNVMCHLGTVLTVSQVYDPNTGRIRITGVIAVTVYIVQAGAVGALRAAVCFAHDLPKFNYECFFLICASYKHLRQNMRRLLG